MDPGSNSQLSVMRYIRNNFSQEEYTTPMPMNMEARENEESLSIDEKLESLQQSVTTLIASLHQQASNHAQEIASLNNKIDKLNQELTYHNQDIYYLKSKFDNYDRKWVYIRANELEKVNNNTTLDVADKSADMVKNEISHACDLQLDTRAVKFLETIDQKRFESASNGFFNLYGFAVDERLSYNPPAPITETLMIRGNVKHADIWKGSSKSEALVDMCDAVIDRWMTSRNNEDCVYPEETMKRDYMHLRDCYYGLPRRNQ